MFSGCAYCNEKSDTINVLEVRTLHSTALSFLVYGFSFSCFVKVLSWRHARLVQNKQTSSVYLQVSEQFLKVDDMLGQH